MLSVCSFNGVKIGWWHHAILALNFSQKKPFVVIYFVFLNSELWEKWKDEHLALEFGLDSSDFPRWLKYWTDCVTGVDGNWFAASSSRTKEIVDGQAILFFFNELFSKCFFFFFSLLCGFLYQKQQRVEIERNPDSDFWLISTVSVVTMASKVAIVFRLLQNSYLQTPILLLLFFFSL